MDELWWEVERGGVAWEDCSGRGKTRLCNQAVVNNFVGYLDFFDSCWTSAIVGRLGISSAGLLFVTFGEAISKDIGDLPTEA